MAGENGMTPTTTRPKPGSRRGLPTYLLTRSAFIVMIKERFKRLITWITSWRGRKEEPTSHTTYNLYAGRVTLERLRENEVVIITRLEIADDGERLEIDDMDFNLFYGADIPDDIAVAAGVDGNCYALANWIRIADKRFGERNYRIALNQLEAIYFSSKPDPEFKSL